MKRVVSIILAVLVTAACFSIGASASETPFFKVKNVSGEEGDTVSVDVSVANNPGITSLQLSLQYSSADLKLLSVEDPQLFGNAVSTSSLDKNPFKVSWYDGDSEDRTENGVLIRLKFKILNGAKTSRITVSYDEENVFNSEFDNMFFSTVNGIVAVGSHEILGDADCNGVVNILDATAIQRRLADYTVQSFSEKRACITSNTLNIIDATLIQRHLANYLTPYHIGEIVC